MATKKSRSEIDRKAAKILRRAATMIASSDDYDDTCTMALGCCSAILRSSSHDWFSEKVYDRAKQHFAAMFSRRTAYWWADPYGKNRWRDQEARRLALLFAAESLENP